MPRNFASLAQQATPLALAALGQMTVIFLGGIDLSVGPVISLVTVIASFVLAVDSDTPVAVALPLCLCVGAAVGLINAVLIVRLHVPDLIATLSTFLVVQGLALIVRPSPGGSVAPAAASAITERIAGYLPILFPVAVALYVIAEVLLLRGRVGARLYAAGTSEEAARAVGLSPNMIKTLSYLFCGSMAALTGLVIAARIGSDDPQAGSTFTLAAITAVVVGGTSIFGGRGTALGTFLGAVLIVLIQNALNQLHVSAYWQYVWTGILTLAAVGFHALHSRESRAGLVARVYELFAGRGD